MSQTLTQGTTAGGHPPEKNYLNETTGIWSWMTTVDHKRIGIMYLVGVSTAFGIGGVFALLVRLALLNPQHTLFGKHWVDQEMYNRFFTMHGVVMVFLFIIPFPDRWRISCCP
jgi:cytochrome c oxidase subunit 1